MAYPAEPTKSFPVQRILTSKINGQAYVIRIHLPFSYAYNDDHLYPVIYVMDGNLFGDMVAGIARLMAFSRTFPEVIIASVGYPLELYGEGFIHFVKRRGSEFTPVADAEFEEEHKKWLGIDDIQSGNAPLLSRFLLEELVPVIESEYRTRSNQRVLLGHSASGLFTLFMLFHQAKEFLGYVVGSPPLSYAKDLMFRVEADYAARHTALQARLFTGIGSQEELLEPKLDAMVSVSASNQFAARLSSRNYAGFHFEYQVFSGFDHLSVPAAIFAAGLKSVLS